MPCESCSAQFSVFKRKRICCECDRYYCTSCLRRGGGNMCAPCRLLSTKPLYRTTIANLKVRDLQCFLNRQNISTRGCLEKDDLVRLCISHVNSTGFRRRGAGAAGGRGAAFTLKGFTNNINDFITSAFDMRHNPNSSARPSNCYNSQHSHAPPPPPSAAQPSSRSERFTATPGGETRIEVPVPEHASPTDSSDSAVVETADCFEVEDLDDSSWELLNASAEPLPTNSDVVISMPADTPRRASSELELGPRYAGVDDAGDVADGASASEEPLASDTLAPEPPEVCEPPPPEAPPPAPARVQLSEIQSEAELEALSAWQLKEMLARNRVGFRGCVERVELLERARTLLRDHIRYRDVLEQLPESEVCKICMSAPVECVLLECGHLAACTACAARLPDCPLCRRYVVRAVRVFRA